MDWVDRQQNYKGLYGILQLLQGSHLDNFPLKTLKLGWVAFHSLTFHLKCLDFQSNQYKELAPMLSCFCNGLCNAVCTHSQGQDSPIQISCSVNKMFITRKNQEQLNSFNVSGLHKLTFCLQAMMRQI